MMGYRTCGDNASTRRTVWDLGMNHLFGNSASNQRSKNIKNISHIIQNEKLTIFRLFPVNRRKLHNVETSSLASNHVLSLSIFLNKEVLFCETCCVAKYYQKVITTDKDYLTRPCSNSPRNGDMRSSVD